MSNEQFIRARLEEAREKLGNFGEPVWSQALAALDELVAQVAQQQRLIDELQRIHDNEMRAVLYERDEAEEERDALAAGVQEALSRLRILQSTLEGRTDNPTRTA